MKKTKLLLAVAMVFVALSFSFKAKAQSNVPVILYTWSGSMSNWSASTTWWVTAHNNTTNEDFYFQTNSYQLRDDGGYHMGYVPTGTYTITVSYYNYNVYYDNFDWYINDQSHEGINMWAQTDYELTNTVVVNDTYDQPNNYGLNIYLWAM
jgi:hypothetical protein